MSQALRIALWIPSDRINTGESVIAQSTANPGQAVDTRMGVAAGGGAPAAGGGVAISTTPPLTPAVGDTWVDISNPSTPTLKVYKQGNVWVVLSDGSPSLPAATRQGQTLVADAAPQFNWQPGDLDGSRY